MTEKLSVVFIGGLTNGKIVRDYLLKNKYVDLKLTITYPGDIEKPRYIRFPSGEKIIKDNHANKHVDEIKKIAPDFIFVVGWSELLERNLVEIPPVGTIGFHPAKLPHDRGRSVLAWQIEEGYTETALTMFYYNEIPDGGDIIAQERIKIEPTDYVNDVLDKVDSATYNLMHAYFPILRQRCIHGKPQELNEGSVRRLRTERDSVINWDQDASNIYNKIRAMSKPYPGATGEINGAKCRIWKSFIVDKFNMYGNAPPGTLVAKFCDNSILVRCRKGFIHITEYEKEEE